jgi:putative transposase
LARLDHPGQRLLYRRRRGDHRQAWATARFNTDQGAQFTSTAFTGLILEHGICISRDGKGCWRDNSFVARIRRSLKYEEVYLHANDSVSAATAGLGRYLARSNTRRPHSILDDRTPDEADFTPRPLAIAA